jgi:signal recognition particle receptor subunit beta
MAELDETSRKLTLKIVYYGPAMSGKTTNLMQLHDLLAAPVKGEVMSLDTRGDRTLFFDLLPLGFRLPSGLLFKLKLYTVPGQVAHDGTRKAVLSRADGVVFVADSQRNQSVNNGEAFENLALNCQRVGLDFESLPLVVQFNKRDLPNVLEEDEIRERWCGAHWPLFFASAARGMGVKETFASLFQALYRRIDPIYRLRERHGANEADFLGAAGLHCGSG